MSAQSSYSNLRAAHVALRGPKVPPGQPTGRPPRCHPPTDADGSLLVVRGGLDVGHPTIVSARPSTQFDNGTFGPIVHNVPEKHCKCVRFPRGPTPDLVLARQEKDKL